MDELQPEQQSDLDVAQRVPRALPEQQASTRREQQSPALRRWAEQPDASQQARRERRAAVVQPELPQPVLEQREAWRVEQA